MLAQHRVTRHMVKGIKIGSALRAHNGSETVAVASTSRVAPTPVDSCVEARADLTQYRDHLSTFYANEVYHHTTRAPLCDQYGRTFKYLRLSVTSRCNLRCVYCSPSDSSGKSLVPETFTYPELLAIVQVGAALGIRKLRLSGGEPLIRQGITRFVEEAAAIPGIEEIGITTNGTTLARLAKGLKKAGVKGINVSLDSLNPKRYEAITRGGSLHTVLAGIEAALSEGFSRVKINAVLLRGVNESDIPRLARLTLSSPIHVRFCEQMPCGGSTAKNSSAPLTAEEALDMINREVGPIHQAPDESRSATAARYRIAGARGIVGMIRTNGNHMCRTCDRLRLTPRGTLRPCLFDSTEIDVRPAFHQGGCSWPRIVELFRKTALAKPAPHSRRKGALENDMNLIGG